MATVSLPDPGELFEARYRVEEMIGEGGFSKVFRATDTQASGRTVALKILTPVKTSSGREVSYEGDLADRFLREARVLSMLDNLHSIKILDHGKTADGVLYMVFEYVEGRDLYQIIKNDGAQEPEFVVKVLEQTLDALRAAHAQAILHRDIKPNNIMISNVNGVDTIKVLDFGIAKAFGDAAGQVPGNDLTAAGTIVGTPRYMPPEQLRGLPVGPASDIYSLGVVGLEMLTGRKAISAKDRLAVVEIQMSAQNLKVPNEVDIPERLRAIVERMLAKNPRLRYSSAAQVIRDLQTWDSDERLGPLHQGETDANGNPVQETMDLKKLNRSPSTERTVLETVDMAQLEMAKKADLDAAPDDKTMLKTVNIAELEAAASQSGLQARPDVHEERTLADPSASRELAMELEPTNEQRNLSSPSTWPPPRKGEPTLPAQDPDDVPTGPITTPPDAQLPGERETREMDQTLATGSGWNTATRDLPQPPTIQERGPRPGFETKPGPPLAVDQSGARPAFAPDTEASMRPPSGSFDQPQQTPNFNSEKKSFELSGADKFILFISFFVPGAAHISFGQTKKGILLVGAILLTFGLVYLVSIAIVFDAYLVLRAKNYREVDEFEIMPDLKDVLG